MRFCAIIMFCALFAPPALAQGGEAKPPITDAAQRIYSAWGDAVYQVQVIDLVSGKKSGIGSGFQFTADGLVATNYHVIASAIRRPEGSRLEYLHDKGETGALSIVAADVVHDLAILKMDTPGKVFVTPGTSSLPKGKRIFALGNPHDIGFMIIEGTFNGLSKESFIDRIHFSGSLNPGMSGGPALDEGGRVVGVNVATAGNQISFLVPVEPLSALYENVVKKEGEKSFLADATRYIGQQLLDSQQKTMDILLDSEWESVPFGPLALPARIHPAIKCWGRTAHKDKDPYRHYVSLCSTQDNVYLGEDFDTAAISYRYDYLVDKGDMNPLRFTSLYERLYSLPVGEGRAREDDVTGFACRTRFVQAVGAPWKTSFCVRQYKQYPALYDLQMYMAMVGAAKEGVTASLNVEGISRENALTFAAKFINNMRVNKEEGEVVETRP